MGVSGGVDGELGGRGKVGISGGRGVLGGRR